MGRKYFCRKQTNLTYIQFKDMNQKIFLKLIELFYRYIISIMSRPIGNAMNECIELREKKFHN